MDKYVVSDEYFIFAICDTEEDAQEFILAMAEERAYEDYCEEMILGNKNMNSEQYLNYICALQDFNDFWTFDEDGRWHSTYRQTTWSAILDAAMHDELFIDEVPCY